MMPVYTLKDFKIKRFSIGFIWGEIGGGNLEI